MSRSAIFYPIPLVVAATIIMPAANAQTVAAKTVHYRFTTIDLPIEGAFNVKAVTVIPPFTPMGFWTTEGSSLQSTYPFPE